MTPLVGLKTGEKKKNAETLKDNRSIETNPTGAKELPRHTVHDIFFMKQKRVHDIFTSITTQFYLVCDDH